MQNRTLLNTLMVMHYLIDKHPILLNLIFLLSVNLSLFLSLSGPPFHSLVSLYVHRYRRVSFLFVFCTFVQNRCRGNCFTRKWVRPQSFPNYFFILLLTRILGYPTHFLTQTCPEVSCYHGQHTRNLRKMQRCKPLLQLTSSKKYTFFFKQRKLYEKLC